MKVTEHAKERMKERCGLNKKSKDRIVQKVFHEGIRHCETKGRLNKWVTSLWGGTKAQTKSGSMAERRISFAERHW